MAKKTNSLDLKFRRGDTAGFTSSSTTGFGLKSATVVRELIQNSLDAAREASRGTAYIRFEVRTSPTNNIPAIDTYEQALKKAIADQKKLSDGKLPDHAELVTNAMTECLKKEHTPTLYVLDNGIGLNEERMNGLLADGLSVKKEGQTGAFGNGHMVVIPASDLRYVLYGGLSKKGNKYTSIASGHAVLASREGQKGEFLSKDGFVLKGYTKDFTSPYIFPANGDIPKYIDLDLQWLKSEWKGSGSVVIVPGFNYFRECNDDKELWDLIEKAAAWNFFAAIYNGELVLKYSSTEKKIEGTLNKSNILKTLRKYSEERRVGRKFLSGANALSAYETISKKKIDISTEIGKITIAIRKLPDGGRSRIDLCRNGMWISGDIPSLDPNKFSELKPFHCVLLIHSDDGETHRLTRNMESPLHDELNIKNLPAAEKQKFKDAMRDIAEKIRLVVPKNDMKAFAVNDFLTVRLNNFSEGKRWSAQNATFKERPLPQPKPQYINEQEEIKEVPNESQKELQKENGTHISASNKRNFRRDGNSVFFQAIPIPTGLRSCRISLLPQEKCAESEFRLVLDEGLDDGCDDMSSDTFIRLKNIRINKKAPSNNDLVTDDNGHVLAVKLGELQIDQKINIETDYVIPEHIKLPEDIPVVLKTQLIRRASQELVERP